LAQPRAKPASVATADGPTHCASVESPVAPAFGSAYASAFASAHINSDSVALAAAFASAVAKPFAHASAYALGCTQSRALAQLAAHRRSSVVVRLASGPQPNVAAAVALRRRHRG
jgi:hypothetical protein